MTLPRDDSDFDGLDPETKFRIESLTAKPVGKLDAGNPQVWFWFDGRGREPPLDSTSGPSLPGAPVMISRIILLAVIAIISVAAYFAGSGAFKPYSAKLFDLFSERTASAPASLPKDETLAAAAATNSDQQSPTPNDFNRSPERPLSETQTQTPVAAAKSTAATQTTASLSKEALATAATNFDHDQLPALNDLSRSPAPLVDTYAQSLVAGAKSFAAPRRPRHFPKKKRRQQLQPPITTRYRRQTI
jgi:FtsZ-interacting cell division protein ZipA